MNLPQKIQDIKQWDDARPGFVGEHWLVLGAGVLLMRRAGRSRGLVGRLLGRAVGGALIARAASGRDGVASKLARVASAAGGLPRPAGRAGKSGS
ncbi:hypothetical protein [Acidovorax sp. FHTAMBA]|uniref:hypothetical protein n=1 Tax=Acidovorax sp. FHTAMBA TaxID=3140252 RepID=UPI003183D33C